MAKYNPLDDTWEYFGYRGFNEDQAWNISLWVENETPYISYNDYNSCLQVMKYIPE